MKKTILITGSTDGIGYEATKKFLAQKHTVLLHGRDSTKLDLVKKELLNSFPNATIKTYLADFSNLEEVKLLAEEIKKNHLKLDVLINNAGVYKTPNTKTKDNLDIRFVVNTIAPYLLTKELFPLLDSSSRVINLSSAAQAPVNKDALLGKISLSDGDAYAQSKLALTMYSFSLAQEKKVAVMVAINPASFLGSKMVKEAYGMEGKDINIDANILYEAALSDEFLDANGKYFDNDIGRFTSPHPDGENLEKSKQLVELIENLLKNLRVS